MRALKVTAVMLGVPLLGLVAALLFAGVALPLGYVDSVRAPGDGFLFIGYAIGSLVITVPLALVLSVVVLRRRPTDPADVVSASPISASHVSASHVSSSHGSALKAS